MQAMARTLAALHSVQPGQVGLQGYGKPSGYNRRQVWRWGQQYSQSVAQVSRAPFAVAGLTGRQLCALGCSLAAAPACLGNHGLDHSTTVCILPPPPFTRCCCAGPGADA